MNLPIKLHLSKRLLLSVGVIALVAAAGAPSYYFYTQYQKTQVLLKDPQAAAKEETRVIVQKVTTLVELPASEEPTVATVTDKNKLQDQPFFARAEIGDKVLLYTQAQKAILYRPSTNKIVEIAPVNLGNTTPGGKVAGASAVATPTGKIAIYNGTVTNGLANTVEQQIKQKYPSLEIAAKDNAKKRDYPRTLVIDISGGKKDLVAQVAQSLGGLVATLPDGEAKPNADILVIASK